MILSEVSYFVKSIDTAPRASNTRCRCLSILLRRFQSLNVLLSITVTDVVSFVVDLYLYSTSRPIKSIWYLSLIVSCIYFSSASIFDTPRILYFVLAFASVLSAFFSFIASTKESNCLVSVVLCV